MPERTRPPPERMAGGYERDDDTDYEASASEAEGMMVCILLSLSPQTKQLTKFCTDSPTSIPDRWWLAFSISRVYWCT